VRWFGYLTDQMLRRSAHRSVQALEEDIRAWTAAWDEDPKPFVWKKAADEILNLLTKCVKRNSGAGHQVVASLSAKAEKHGQLWRCTGHVGRARWAANRPSWRGRPRGLIAGWIVPRGMRLP
jgi:hypothetical protein